MRKEQVVAILSEIGTLLELQGENAFKCQAYHNAARTIEQLDRDLADVVATGELGTLKGIGEALQLKITTLVTTGKLPYYDNLRAQVPEGLLTMLRVAGLGPKKVRALHQQLGIDTLDKLKAACESGSVAGLKGFGEKTQQKILEGIEFIKLTGTRLRIDQVLPVAVGLIQELKQLPEVQRIELCGSLRRRKETIKDIDILVSSNTPQPIMDRLVTLPGVVQVIGTGSTKTSVVVESTTGGHRALINCDLRVVSDEQFPFALHYFTGSKEHNVAMRVRAIDRGLKLNEYGLAGPSRTVQAKDEADIFRALDLDYIPPELREDTGECAAAENGKLPHLLQRADIQGVFHCHTTWSDGANTLEEMAHAAHKLGLKYLGLGDHSHSLTVANGLSPERVRQQQEQIDALNKKLKGLHLFKGIECDILADGSLDYDDEVLSTFDYVVASVHSHFNLTRDEMTDRILKAMRHPLVTMLGHPTGRLLLRREAYQVDLDAVLHEAARLGTMIEINAHPMRLDLDWIHCKRARDLGVTLVINPDAHHIDDIAYYAYGVDVARRGWLDKGNVFNTHSLAEVTRELQRRKKAALAKLGLKV